MSMNWDDIKYLFQLPLEWFKAIHKKVFNAYGTNFIKVRDGSNGAMQIDIDQDAFSQQVLEITGGGSGGGTVKAVDGIAPNANGNVTLGAIRSVNHNFYPDADGNIEVGIGVSSVNGNQPDANGNVTVPVGQVNSVNGIAPVAGNVELGNLVTGVDGVVSQDFGMLHLGAVRSVNGKTPDANYNVNVGTVKTVNGVSPDDGGNVEVEVLPELAANKWVKTNSEGEITTTNETPIVVGPTAIGLVFVSNGTVTYVPIGLNGVAAGNHGHNLADLNNDAGFVDAAEVNAIVNGKGFVTEANVEDIIAECNFATQDELGDYVTKGTVQTITANKIFQIGNRQIAIRDGHIIECSGDVLSLYSNNNSANLSSLSNGTVKSSLIVTPDGRVVAIATGTIEASTPANITMTANGAAYLRTANAQGTVLGMVSTATDHAQMSFGDDGWFIADTDGIRMGDGASTNGTIALNNTNGVIRLLEGGSNGSRMELFADRIVCKIGDTSDSSKRIGIETSQMSLRHDSKVEIQSLDSASGQIVLNTRANSATLANAPTVAKTTTTSKAIATCGWTASNFAAKGTLAASKWVKTDAGGALVTTDETPISLSKAATGFLYNTNGTLSYIAFGTGANQVAMGNHSHNTSRLVNDAGFVNAAGVNAIVDEKDFATQTDIDDALEDFVTLDTQQTITGNKSFGSSWDEGTRFLTQSGMNQVVFGRYTILNAINNNRLTIQAGSAQKYLDFNTNNNGVFLHSDGAMNVTAESGKTSINGNGVTILSRNGTIVQGQLDMNSTNILLKYGTGGFALNIDNNSISIANNNHYCMYATDTSISLGGGDASVTLFAHPNEAQLSDTPTISNDDITSKAIATCGWVARNFQATSEETVSATKTVVTGVSWDGAKLTYTSENWTFENGLLTNVATAQPVTIDTPVAY